MPRKRIVLLLLTAPAVLLLAMVCQWMIWKNGIDEFDWKLSVKGHYVDMLLDESHARFYLLTSAVIQTGRYRLGQQLSLTAVTLEGEELWTLKDASVRINDYEPGMSLHDGAIMVSGRQGSRVLVSPEGGMLWEARSGSVTAEGGQARAARWLCSDAAQLYGVDQHGQTAWVQNLAELGILAVIAQARLPDGRFCTAVVAGAWQDSAAHSDDPMNHSAGQLELQVLSASGDHLATHPLPDMKGVSLHAFDNNALAAFDSVADYPRSHGKMAAPSNFLLYSADPEQYPLVPVPNSSLTSSTFGYTAIVSGDLLLDGRDRLSSDGRISSHGPNIFTGYPVLHDGSRLVWEWQAVPMLERIIGNNKQAFEYKRIAGGTEQVLMSTTDIVNYWNCRYAIGNGWLIRARPNGANSGSRAGSIELQGYRLNQ